MGRPPEKARTSAWTADVQSASPALRAAAFLAVGALVWTIVFFSHLPVVVGAACSATLGRVFPLPDGCGLDWAFWPSGFETPKAWVLAGMGILAGLLAVAGGALRLNFPLTRGIEGVYGIRSANDGGKTPLPSPLVRGEAGPTPLLRTERRALFGILAALCVSTIAADRAIAPYLADPAWWAWLRSLSAAVLPPFGSVAGIPEKYHGLLFWLGLAGSWLALRTALSPQGLRKAARVALVALAATGPYALAQRLGHDPLAWDTRVDLSRAFSTMGNPNYYAGLLLPGAALAFWAFEKRRTKILVATALAAILLMTGSLYGMALLAAWGVWEAARRAGMVGDGVPAENVGEHKRGSSLPGMPTSAKRPFARRALGWAAVTLALAGALAAAAHLAQSYGIVRHAPWACQNGVAAAPAERRACLGGDWQWVGDAEKWKGFVARAYIGASVWDSLAENPKTFLFGRGPDALKAVFERFRRPELRGDYEDPRYVADSAHDWILDMWHAFGLVGLLAIAVPAALAARRLRGPRKTALALWAAYFLCNVPVSADWALAALVLASAGNGGKGGRG